MADTDPPESTATRRWRFLLIGSLLAFGLVIAGVAVAELPEGQGSPESAVEGYLDALLAGEAEAALEYVDPASVPTGPEAGFLTAEALTGGWSVAAIQRTDDNDTTAEVKVTFSAAGAEQRSVFHVSGTRVGGDEVWWLDFPFETVEPDSLPFEYLEIGELAVDRSLLTEGAYLFPGLYRFYGGADGVEPLGGERAAVFPDGDDDGRDVPLGAVTATSGTVDEVREHLDRLIDACAEAERIDPYGCPFGLARIEDPIEPRLDLDDVHDVAWELGERPRIELTAHPDGDAAFAVVTTSAGTAAVTGSGRDSDGRPYDFTVHTDIEIEDFTVTLGRDGSVTVTDPDGRRM